MIDSTANYVSFLNFIATLLAMGNLGAIPLKNLSKFVLFNAADINASGLENLWDIVASIDADKLMLVIIYSPENS